MATIATGINKLLTIKKQASLGAIVTNASGQNLRRLTSTLDKKKASYQSKEIRPSQQISDFRHGVVGVEGSISGELSVGSYQLFVESILRQISLAPVVSAAMTDIVAASTSANMGTFTTTAGNFLTGVLNTCFKTGMVIRATNFTTTAAANNGANFLIIGLTAKVMTVARLDGSAVVSKTETSGVVFTEPGKHTYTPQSGHTRDYYTIEHNFVDIAQSEKFTDCVVTQMDVKLPATGIASIDFSIKGLNMIPGTTGFFVSPNAIATGGVLAAANGALFLQGQPVAIVTGLNFSVKGGHSLIGGVVGSNVEPDIFPGDLTADGQVTVLFQDNVVRDMFLNETEAELYCVFTADNTASSNFIAFSFPRLKFSGANKDDGEKGLVMTMPFIILEDIAAGLNNNSHPSSVIIQDSLFF